MVVLSSAVVVAEELVVAKKKAFVVIGFLRPILPPRFKNVAVVAPGAGVRRPMPMPPHLKNDNKGQRGVLLLVITLED